MFIRYKLLFVFIGNIIGQGISVTRLGYEYVEQADSWLRLHIVPANWSDARLRCHLEGGQLASPTSNSLITAMKSKMAAHGLALRSVFTGIHATISKGDFITMDGVPLSNLNVPWAQHEPDNAGDAEDCLALSGAGEAADVRCASALPYFCRKTNANMVLNSCGTTDYEYNRDQRTGSCYKFRRVPRTWHRAAGACAAEGAHLTVINSPAESQVLKELFAGHSAESLRQADYNHIAHIGFWDWHERKEWLTIFGESFTEAGFEQWERNEPNNAHGRENCGSVLRNGLLNDCNCESRLAFVCEITPAGN